VAMTGTGRTAMAILDAARIEAGDVVVVTAAAHAALEARATLGKVVLMASQAK
jgi:NADPH-dependent curcumin reductase CurA